MLNFKIYYNIKFREDLNTFFSSIPDESKFHEDRLNKQIFSIQFERLTHKNNHLIFLDHGSKELFSVALFFTVLVDMVCYTHYNEHYNKFSNLKNSPKLIGDCLSWCHTHLHPEEIFRAMNHGAKPNERLLFQEKLLEASEYFKEEVISFFGVHMQEIYGIEFWRRCKTEFKIG